MLQESGRPGPARFYWTIWAGSGLACFRGAGLRPGIFGLCRAQAELGPIYLKTGRAWSCLSPAHEHSYIGYHICFLRLFFIILYSFGQISPIPLSHMRLG